MKTVFAPPCFAILLLIVLFCGPVLALYYEPWYLDISMEFEQNDSLHSFHAAVTEGGAPYYMNSSMPYTNYSFEELGADRHIMEKGWFFPSDFESSTMHSDYEATIRSPYRRANIRFPYWSDARYVVISNGQKVIREADLATLLCNHDGKCAPPEENLISCPDDCKEPKIQSTPVLSKNCTEFNQNCTITYTGADLNINFSKPPPVFNDSFGYDGPTIDGSRMFNQAVCLAVVVALVVVALIAAAVLGVFRKRPPSGARTS